MKFDRTKPFNTLPLLPPPFPLETREILKQAIETHRALAELKHVGALLPNQAVLTQTLALQEAKLSSEIENVVTTNDELYRAHVENELSISHETKEVLHYQEALWYGFRALKEEKRLLTTPLFEELCQMLKAHNSGIRKAGGTKLANLMGEVMYTPPEGENVIRDKLRDLENFIYKDDSLDPLIKLALIHYQFEAIHPFYDGNGRTGRIINILYLIDQGLLHLPILYLSRYFLQNKQEYYTGLRNVTEHEKWQEWIYFVLKAIEQTSRTTQKKIHEIYELIQITTEKVKHSLPRIYSKELMDVIFSHPYCKIRFLEEAKIAKRQAGSKYLMELESIGILRSEQHGRERYYINNDFLKILSQW